MRPQPPNCENQAPYCHRGGQPMKCVEENEKEWVFACISCGQVRILTTPAYRAALRREVRDLNGIKKFY